MPEWFDDLLARHVPCLASNQALRKRHYQLSKVLFRFQLDRDKNLDELMELLMDRGEIEVEMRRRKLNF